ncbi:MAG: bifunctional 3,4-dihydroxy-2-butanone-4-phosphate synthase/GTP cyclohydrolase II [Pseudomonadota bacterium]|nr:bifunctional 3,4-dihydroxy-2-butanone-4-phosphate synthase/GTP cyclohydrolase II [Pseudomonadota bacterium]
MSAGPRLVEHPASPFDRIEDILADIAAGRMVVIVDDEDRENEGDLLMAAARVRPEDINFMARFGRGLICLTLTRERCAQLRLPLMVSDTDRQGRTNFTVSIEAAEGITTGISAYDRAHTVRTAVVEDARPEHLVQPGHIFPLMAQPGGVLTRAGHTEAGCDLARLAGLTPAAVIVEIMNDDGTMARRPELIAFARQHGLRMGTIRDLIRYRLRTERSVERIAQRQVQTEFGEFDLHCYEDHVHRGLHLVLTRGDLKCAALPLVRVHVADTLRDLLGVRGDARAWTLRDALQRIAQEPCGALVILREPETPRALADAVQGLECRDGGTAQHAQSVLRTYGIGAQILKDLGMSRIRVLSAPKQLQGISGFDLEVVEYVD